MRPSSKLISLSAFLLIILWVTCNGARGFGSPGYFSGWFPPITFVRYYERYVTKPDHKKSAHAHDAGRTIDPPRKEGDNCIRDSDWRKGVCVASDKCLQARNSADVCSYKEDVSVVCCLRNFSHLRPSARKCQQYNQELRDTDLSRNLPWSGHMCAEITPLVINGDQILKHEYAHVAALGRIRDDQTILWQCLGTLINEFYVLTSAHCLVYEGGGLNVARLGVEILSNAPDDQHDYALDATIIYGNYTPTLYYHDIGLVRLQRAARLALNIRPACLWQWPDLERAPVTAAGYADIWNWPSADQRPLEKVDMNIVDKETCSKIYVPQSHYPLGITDELLCAGVAAGQKDTCYGDSGGPLHMKLTKHECVNIVVGITSFGSNCGATNTPGVYTKVYPYLSWIERMAFQ